MSTPCCTYPILVYFEHIFNQTGIAIAIITHFVHGVTEYSLDTNLYHCMSTATVYCHTNSPPNTFLLYLIVVTYLVLLILAVILSYSCDVPCLNKCRRNTFLLYLIVVTYLVLLIVAAILSTMYFSPSIAQK